MKIGILGTRGIPNKYGGFEQCAEHLALGLVKNGHEVTVYNPHNHTNKEVLWNSIHIVHCYDPEYKLGTPGQFIYDLNCILDARKRGFDIILQLGYSSSSVWGWLLPRKTVITTNMDGLEWKRTKFSKPVQLFLRFAEFLAVKSSDYLISDSHGIQRYLLNRYKIDSIFIPYGAYQPKDTDARLVSKFNIEPGKYYLLIARLEPENNTETILDGFVSSGSEKTFIVVGGINTKYAKFLINKYHCKPSIRFIGAVYDGDVLNSMRYFSLMYFHGHSVGGTNPSLLEAMACQCTICAHDNEFNKDVLGTDAYLFKNSEDISDLLQSKEMIFDSQKPLISSNLEKIEQIYNWNKVIMLYENHFNNIYKRRD